MKRRNAFTLIEILIVVVIMAILAATIVPQFTDSTGDAKTNTALFNLGTLRSQIELYQAQHEGLAPDPLTRLTEKTNAAGTTDVADGTLKFGPYLQFIPENTLNSAATVKLITNDPPVLADVTAGDTGGWLYNKTSGGVWLDHSTQYTK